MPLYGATKTALLGLTRSAGPIMAKENIRVNCICPSFIMTNLCPKPMAHRWPKEHTTPMSTYLKAVDTLIGNQELTGQVVEATLDELHYRKPYAFANASQEWITNESMWFWEEVAKYHAEQKE